MADTVILSGIEASDALYNSLHARIDALKEKGITPGLAAILVGENPASQIYVRNKTKKFDSLGLKSDIYRLPEDTKEEELLDLINKINNDEKYNFRTLIIQILFPMTFLLITIYLLFGDQLISFVAGEEFQESIMPMVILLFGYIAFFVTFWTRHYLLLNDLILKHTIGRIINLVVFIISSSILITQFSFNGIALSISLGIISQKIYEVFVYVKSK